MMPFAFADEKEATITKVTTIRITKSNTNGGE